MKRITAALLSVLAMGTAAYAQAADDCVAVVYKDGSLFSCAGGIYENGIVYAAPVLPEGDYIVKAYFTDDGTVEIDKASLMAEMPEATPEPTPEVTPQPTPTATEAPAKAPRPTYHPVYESERDAVEAIAVVQSVGVVASDDDNMYEIKALYRGEEFSFIVEQEVDISSAPEIMSELSGESLLQLEKGDVIMITCYISGGVKRVDLIARATDYDIITSGADVGEGFEDLFSTGGVVASRWKALEYGKNPPSDGTCYAFGVIRERKNGTMVLVNEGGLDSEAHYLDLSENVIVYTCDIEDKKELSIGGESNIVRSSIPKTDLDDEDNVINWDESRSYNYALARVVEGTVTEVVVYTGYEQ